ncbi:MAG: hypothetical protein AAF433_13715 [Bacteroidota bacterium]
MQNPPPSVAPDNNETGSTRKFLGYSLIAVLILLGTNMALQAGLDRLSLSEETYASLSSINGTLFYFGAFIIPLIMGLAILMKLAKLFIDWLPEKKK